MYASVSFTIFQVLVDLSKTITSFSAVVGADGGEGENSGGFLGIKLLTGVGLYLKSALYDDVSRGIAIGFSIKGEVGFF